MQIEITLTEVDLRKLVVHEIQRRMGDVPLDRNEVKVEVKSSQNYKSEWETAHFRARVSVAR